MDIRFDFRWHYGDAPGEEIHPEIFRLLRAIRESGSLRAAANACRLSYRHAWGLLQAWEHRTGHTLVYLKRGSGAELSALGEKIIEQDQRIRSRLEPELSSLASELAMELNTLLEQPAQERLNICASHGLVVAMLRDLARIRQKPLLHLEFQGSLDSLRSLKNGVCNLAGFHLPEGEAGARFLARIRRYLNPKSDALIYTARRRQGLMTAPGNPLAIRELADLVEKAVRFVNRQESSGTRITFDQLLEDQKIKGRQIQGYELEEFTHLAVAALVASGGADCAFGIEEAARKFGLHFIPFNWERYWFILPRTRLNWPPVVQLLSLLRDTEFRQGIKDISGYEESRSGSVVMPDPDLQVLLL